MNNAQPQAGSPASSNPAEKKIDTNAKPEAANAAKPSVAPADKAAVSK